VLHHGSLVLTRPTLTPFAAAVADTTAVAPPLRLRLAAAVAERLATALALTPTSGDLSAAETALALQLAAERYGNPAFTDQR
jgi:hypothetical protein